MMRNIRTFMAIALSVVALAMVSSAAMAQSYTGNFPVTVSKSKFANGKYCLELTEQRGDGFPRGGTANLVPANGTEDGTFTVINGLLTATFPTPEGANIAFQLFTAHASDGNISKGEYELAYGGFYDFGLLAVGAKGGC
jgi:uncharacterized protein (DUF2141 family)